MRCVEGNPGSADWGSELVTTPPTARRHPHTLAYPLAHAPRALLRSAHNPHSTSSPHLLISSSPPAHRILIRTFPVNTFDFYDIISQLSLAENNMTSNNRGNSYTDNNSRLEMVLFIVWSFMFFLLLNLFLLVHRWIKWTVLVNHNKKET